MGEARDSAMACYTPSTEVKFKKIMFPVFFSLIFRSISIKFNRN